MLIVFGGLPGTGKTALSRPFAAESGAVYLRIDTIEQAVRESCGLGDDVGAAGYEIAYGLARDNLRLGRAVIADCVNPIAITRNAWRDLAAEAGAPIVEVEVVCSDKAEHRRRVETRRGDIAGLKLPVWDEIAMREYEAWDRPHLILDTARMTPVQALEELRRHMDARLLR
jgi:predicted kinase